VAELSNARDRAPSAGEEVSSNDDRDRGSPAGAGVGGVEGRLIDARGVPSGDGTPHYRLRPSVELFPARDGDVYLLRAGGASPIAVRRPSPDDRRALDRLAGGGLAVPRGSELAERIAPLVAAGVVVPVVDEPPLPAELAERFARQLPYHAETGSPAAALARLRTARVVVLGCGGLGTWALAGLAAVGVGRLRLVDDDAVELSNLNRQILFGVDDLGRRKAELAASWVRRFDPGIEVDVSLSRVRGAEDVEALVGDADALVLAADWPPYELGRWVNAACMRAGVPFVVAGQAPPLLKVGPTYVPGAGPCFECHERGLAAAYPHYPALAEHRRRVPAPATTLGPASGVLGTMIALEVLHLLTCDGPVATQGRAWLLDLRTLDQRWEDVERRPECRSCALVGSAGDGQSGVPRPPDGEGAQPPAAAPRAAGAHPQG
jgi:bacteriocin biosynthesis cyclodehydratase domain-containing protein